MERIYWLQLQIAQIVFQEYFLPLGRQQEPSNETRSHPHQCHSHHLAAAVNNKQQRCRLLTRSSVCNCSRCLTRYFSAHSRRDVFAPRRHRRDPGEVLHDDLGGLRLARSALPTDNDGLVGGPSLPSPHIRFRLRFCFQVPLHLTTPSPSPSPTRAT